MATITEMDILRIEHQLITEMNLITSTSQEESRDLYMQVAGINAMADELIEKLKKKEADIG